MKKIPWGQILILILIIGCPITLALITDNGPRITKHELKIPIRRSFMHHPGSYSVLVEQDQKLISMDLSSNLYPPGTDFVIIPRSSARKTTVYTDVPKNEQPYLVIKYETSQTDGLSSTTRHYFTDVLLHIHSAEEIEGAGWKNDDKWGKTGTTVPLE